MSDSTRISWTDATWSPVTGCTKVSDGCLNCYIERTPPFRMNGRAFACPRCGGTGYVEDSDGNRLAFGKAGKPLLGAQCTRCAGTGRAGVGDLETAWLMDLVADGARLVERIEGMIAERLAEVDLRPTPYAAGVRNCARSVLDILAEHRPGTMGGEG